MFVGSNGVDGSSIPVTSSPSVKPSPSLSGFVGSVPSGVFGSPSGPFTSSSFVKPSPSQSPVGSVKQSSTVTVTVDVEQF